MAGHRREGRPAPRLRLARLLGLALALAVLGPAACRNPFRAMLPERGAVEGRVVLRAGAPGEGAASEALHVVVYLAALDAGGPRAAKARAATVRLSERSFLPEPLTVARGQTVRFRNEGGVYHRPFSSSEGNAFDLGLVKSGESRELRFDGEGSVRVYCSLHPWENGAIFVAPTPHFAAVRLPGHYRIAEVPPGRYRVATWGDALPSTSHVVTVETGRAASVTLAIGPPGATP